MSKIDQASWYLRRFTSMSASEVLYRLQQQTIIQKERLLYARKAEWPHATCDSNFKHKFYRDEANPFFFREHEQELLRKAFQQHLPNNLEQLIKKADALCQHKIKIFGHHFELETPINWHKDPFTHRVWPQIFAHAIDIRDGKTIGGVKWVWELNRHHHLVTLGKAYFLTRDEKYAVAIGQQLDSWLNQNPPLQGVNWTSALELALRLINWAWVLAFMRTSSVLTSELFARICKAVSLQASYIARHLSKFSSANNHLIGEAAGLAITGLCFPWLTQAEEWQQTGFSILTTQIELQVYSDGVPAEQSPDYLSFVLDFNLQVWLLAQKQGYEPPTIWLGRLGAAAEFLASMMDQAGNIPSIGDSDDAVVVPLNTHQSPNNYQSILTTTTVLLNRKYAKNLTWDEKNLWLLGTAGQITFGNFSATESFSNSRVFAKGGYVVFRSEDHLTLFDCGPLGYLSTAAHGHADALSIILNKNGQPFLIDPGTYAYQEGSKWRKYFRSTAAHNTIVIDNQNQSEMQGAFLWGRKANTKLLAWQTTNHFDFAMASHDGYAHIGVEHQRAVLFYKSDWLIILDLLSGEQRHGVQQFWHLPPINQTEVSGNKIQIINRAQAWQMYFFERPSAMQISTYSGEETPIQGWASQTYGHKKAAPVVCLEGNIQLPATIGTAIYIGIDKNNITDSDHLEMLTQKINEEVKKVII